MHWQPAAPKASPRPLLAVLSISLAAACASGPIRSGGDRPAWTSNVAAFSRCTEKTVCAVGTTSVGAKDAPTLLASLDSTARGEIAATLASTLTAEVKSFDSVSSVNGQTTERMSAEQRVSQVVKEFDLGPAITIVDRFREGDTAYALAVLDKQQAMGLQQGKLADRMRLAQELVAQGDEKATAAPADALRAYARARTEADAALGGVLLLRALGGKAELAAGAAQAEGKFSALAGKLVLTVAAGDGQRAGPGKALAAPVVFAATIDGQPAAGIPLAVTLQGGRAEAAITTGPDGRAPARVDDVGPFTNPEQRIAAAVDWARLVGAEKAPAWAAASRKEISAVAIKKSLETTRVLVLLRETIEGGKPVTEAPAQSAVTNALKNAGLDVKDGKALVEKLGGEGALATVTDVKLKEDARSFGDVLVVGPITSRESGKFGATTAWHRARADVRVIDLATGQVLRAFADEEKGKRPGVVDVAGRSALEALSEKLAPLIAKAVADAAQ